MTTVFGFLDGSLGLGEMLMLGIIAVLLFGKRLPDVSRSLGRALAEFRRSLNEIHNEVDWSSSGEPRDEAPVDHDYEFDDEATSGERFELTDAECDVQPDAEPDVEPDAESDSVPDAEPADQTAAPSTTQTTRDPADPQA